MSGDERACFGALKYRLKYRFFNSILKVKQTTVNYSYLILYIILAVPANSFAWNYTKKLQDFALLSFLYQLYYNIFLNTILVFDL